MSKNLDILQKRKKVYNKVAETDSVNADYSVFFVVHVHVHVSV